MLEGPDMWIALLFYLQVAKSCDKQLHRGQPKRTTTLLRGKSHLGYSIELHTTILATHGLLRQVAGALDPSQAPRPPFDGSGLLVGQATHISIHNARFLIPLLRINTKEASKADGGGMSSSSLQ